MSLHGGLRISHHALDNMHQNELEINSLDVDRPHCSWQIGPRLKSCALTVAPPPCCIGGVRNSHHRSFVREEDPELSSIHRLCALPGHRGASRRQICRHWKSTCPRRKRGCCPLLECVRNSCHCMQCKNTSATPSGRAMTPIGVIVASFRPMFLHAMAAPTPASVRRLCALPGRRCAS